ncbi:serine/threonine/tyrosine-interacting-like protein 1 isoform X2 [Dreissena polymorpha]|uniref:Serine/threonine/tyrosine-interacting-like protein 1 n=1 Tax=Dreissena polymorpha TaxID=45954 RepID=A0A9D4S5X7_DREPO|nr:serine/threonine/tyrosine-interacting-like protein 1 isoform X2 [Dreissena polymorpha]KAH3891810.1 hypothetical protein DPMN_015918 [Dreissena polymorpha]
MEGIALLEPTELYNMLQQCTVYSNLSDHNYLLLIDARNKNEYNESHIVTAKKAPKNKDGQFFVPFDSELECRQNVVVYDSNSSSFNELNDATDCASLFWQMGSRNKVYILKGGYEEFSALYPFLRTQKIIFMPKELDEIKPYPAEILPGFLYLGNWHQGNAPYIQKDLKIKGHINCCVEAETFFPANSGNLLHIQCVDSSDANLAAKFELACKFLDSCKDNKKPVLVFSNLGISRSVAIVIAYLIYHKKMSLKDAFNHAHKCSNFIQPVQSFMDQLADWEKKIRG